MSLEQYQPLEKTHIDIIPKRDYVIIFFKKLEGITVPE